MQQIIPLDEELNVFVSAGVPGYLLKGRNR
jgi:hypothetical protein